MSNTISPGEEFVIPIVLSNEDGTAIDVTDYVNFTAKFMDKDTKQVAGNYNVTPDHTITPLIDTLSILLTSDVTNTLIPGRQMIFEIWAYSIDGITKRKLTYLTPISVV